MDTGFNAEEILEMACQIERNGASYYRQAAALVTDENSKIVLLDFANMEDDHEDVFEKMKVNLGSNPIPNEILTPEAISYLRIIADRHIFPADKKPDADIKPDTSLKNILLHALKMENNSILFYLGLMEAMPAEWGHDKIRSIIREEMKHVALINGLISAL